ncbi:lantibiotic dehydratase C-terminal domain-containing protein [Streptomyces sp. NPDC048442]|uniref:lantibiotic dehydratase C-terminal domain-containing protein n=1 Tax=Streptomyces sp. NPDC048442 TaxID=3154823 RepID=UPI003436EA31
MTDRPWVSLHAFHTSGTDALLTGAVAPLLATLEHRGLITGHFFLRYWEGGPHLRLRLRCAPADATASPAAVTAQATDALVGWLAGRPADKRPSADELARLSGQLAQAEGLHDFDRRIRTRDGVERIPYRPEYRAYGGPEAVAAVERHFTDSSRIALELLTAGADLRQRAAFALTAQLLALAAWEPDRERIGALFALTPRLPAPPVPDALRQRAELCWQLASGTAPAEVGGPSAAWWRSVRRLRAELAALHEGGRLAPTATDPLYGLDATALQPGDRAVLVVLMRCVHLLHNRLGLTTDRELHLRSLVGAALICRNDTEETS